LRPREDFTGDLEDDAFVLEGSVIHGDPGDRPIP
jgi:hypothetical protein